MAFIPSSKFLIGYFNVSLKWCQFPLSDFDKYRDAAPLNFCSADTFVLFSLQALQYVLIPMFQVSFERGEGDTLIGGPPSPEQDSNENVISVFVRKVVDPDNPFGTSVSTIHLLRYIKVFCVTDHPPLPCVYINTYFSLSAKV